MEQFFINCLPLELNYEQLGSNSGRQLSKFVHNVPQEGRNIYKLQVISTNYILLTMVLVGYPPAYVALDIHAGHIK